MCGDGRHPPDSWGHLTLVEFSLDVYSNWTVHIEADDLPAKNYARLNDAWVDAEGVEVDAEGSHYLDVRCFGKY